MHFNVMTAYHSSSLVSVISCICVFPATMSQNVCCEKELMHVFKFFINTYSMNDICSLRGHQEEKQFISEGFACTVFVGSLRLKVLNSKQNKMITDFSLFLTCFSLRA